MVDAPTIIEGIRQFGLAPDGSDLRDLEVAYADLERQIAALIKDIDRLQTKAAVAVDRAREVERHLAEARAELKILRAEMGGQNAEAAISDWRALKDRAEAAEADNARLREALQKILNEHDILSGNYGDVMDPRHIKPDRWPDAANKARAALAGKE